MFQIIGADGKEYGPIPAETVRQWIAEGRAGATTKVRPADATAWTELKSLPEFAAEFHRPPPAISSSGRVPPLISTLAWAMFAVTAFSTLMILVSLIRLLNIPADSAFHPGITFYFHWAVAIISLPVRIAAGIGLLRRKEWSRKLAIGLGAVSALFGAWGLFTMVQSWITHPQMFPSVLMSPMYVISTLWSIAMFLFNLATVVILLRKDVRAVFATGIPSGAV